MLLFRCLLLFFLASLSAFQLFLDFLSLRLSCCLLHAAIFLFFPLVAPAYFQELYLLILKDLESYRAFLTYFPYWTLILSVLENLLNQTRLFPFFLLIFSANLCP